MRLVDEFPECDPEQAISCRIVYDWTGNETAANVAEWLIGRPLAILVLILLGLLARWLVHRVVDRLVRRAEEGIVPGRVGSALRGGDTVAAGRRVQRARTMGSLLKSIATGVILAIVLMMVIGELGYNVAPLLASAGILGLALGFGAQTLVRDFLSGIFMILEDQYGVGDVVDVGEATGTVEAVGLRVTRLRDVNGTVWYVRNGEVLRVGNMSQNWARTVLDVGVGYAEDLARVRRVLEEVAHGMWEDEDYRGKIIEEPEVWGVEALAADSVTVRVTLKTAPMEQWAIAREMRQRIKARFDHEGIEIPFPQRVVWHREQPPADAATAPADGASSGE
jgi:small-conductance mechanosensitive channel